MRAASAGFRCERGTAQRRESRGVWRPLPPPGPVFSARGRNKARLLRRRPASRRGGRHRTGTGSPLCRRPARPARRPVRTARRPGGISAPRPSSCQQRSETRPSAAQGDSRPSWSPRWSNRSRCRSPRPAPRGQAGRREPLEHGGGASGQSYCWSEARSTPLPDARIGCARRRRAKGAVVAERAALITGASSGIGLAIARVLGSEGYGLTVAARRPEKLEAAADELRAEGIEGQSVAANMTEEEDGVGVFAKQRETYGRLDVLVNNAGVGIGAPMEEIQTKHLDMQLGVNLRALILGTREGLPLLREAGAEHGKALIVNTASIAGKGGQAWLSIYAATKAAVINFTQSTHREAGSAGIQCTALAPGFVETPMTEFVQGQIPPEEMIRPEDLGEAVRFLLRTSKNCHIPEIVLTRPGESLDPP